MIIVLTSGLVSNEVLAMLPKLPNGCAVGYSTMHPVQSPMFSTRKEVNDWYNETADTVTKLKFIRNGCFAIYVHEICPEDCVLDHGYHAKQGEILSTDEAAVWDYAEKRWL